jgi:uncharacterized membrane protein
MNSTLTLKLLWTPWSAALSIAAVLITAGLCWIAWRRSGYARAQGLLELCRFGLVALVAVALNQPEWVEEFRPIEKPTILVLWDNSRSMDTRDVPTSSPGGSTMETRREAIRQLTDETTWAPLRERMDVVLQQFSPSPGLRTDLYEPLSQAPDTVKNLAGVVLISDGDWNEGPPPVQAATKLRLKGVPVFTVPVGSTTRLPDVELITLGVPTFGVVGKAIRIPFTIESTLPREYLATVTLKPSDGDPVTEEVKIAAMGRTSGSVLWKPAKTGDVTLTLDVPRHPDETILDNNRLSAPIAIRDEKLRVLIVESVPRWEYRYLRNALSRDPGVEVACLLFHPGLGKVGGGTKDYIKQFPAGLEELSKFDVVFLGDIGREDSQLTAEQCRLLKGLVEHQASGLVFMPGPQGRQFSLLDTPLADLYPVVMDDTQPGGWGSRTPGRFELTETGRRSLLTNLADTPEANQEVWDDLPGFQWYAPVVRAKGGTEVLAVHKDASNAHGRLPLLVTRTFGAGKVLFMGTDGAWRWRKGVEDMYHYRFWGQVVRWMAYQRNMAKGETMRLYYSPDQPQVRQTIALNANVMERSGEPLTKGDVSARVTSPSGQVETVRFTAAGEEWGLFRSRFTAVEPGRHTIVLSCKQTGATLEASIFVQGDIAERVGRPARPDVLEEIARVTHGKTLAPGKIDQLLQSLAALPEPPPSVRRVQLWSHPVFAGIVIFVLGMFWTLRKVVGLI